MRCSFLLAILLVLTASPSWAAVAFVNGGNQGGATNSMVGDNVVSATMVVNTGTNLCAVALVAYSSVVAQPTITMTWDGVSMPAITGTDAFDVTSLRGTQAFQLPNPATGSKTLALSGSDAGGSYGAALMVYSGADQTNCSSNGTKANGVDDGAGNFSLTVTSVAGDMTTTVTTTTFDSQTTNKTLRTYRGALPLGTDDAAGAATVTHTWNDGSINRRYAIGGFSIKAAVASSPRHRAIQQ